MLTFYVYDQYLPKLAAAHADVVMGRITHRWGRLSQEQFLQPGCRGGLFEKGPSSGLMESWGRTWREKEGPKAKLGGRKGYGSYEEQ